MICHHQAVELLQPYVAAGDSLLDVGCGSGYFYHALRDRNVPVEYWGIDATSVLVDIGRKFMPHYGLPAERLQVIRVEDVRAEVDHVICTNVLSNLDNYHRPFERMLKSARKTVILRESISDRAHYSYVADEYLDEGIRLSVHVNTYARQDIADFASGYGFDVIFYQDRFSGGEVQMVIGYPHWWTFAVAVRR